jgi:hypothetical protein
MIDYASLPLALRAKYEPKPVNIKSSEKSEIVSDEVEEVTSENKCCMCDLRSRYSVIGSGDEGVYLTRYCTKHYFQDKNGKIPKEVENNEDSVHRRSPLEDNEVRASEELLELGELDSGISETGFGS